MHKGNVLFVASEAAPLAKTGGLADVVGSLPHALTRLGLRVSVVLPYYRQHVAASGVAVEPFGDSIKMWIDGMHLDLDLYVATIAGVRFILVDQRDLFDRPHLYGPPGGAYEDNPLRFVLLARAALEIGCRIEGGVALFHCHDWQAAMLPLLLRYQYRDRPQIAAAKTVYTIHNLAYQGLCDPSWMYRLGIPADLYHPEGIEFYGQVNFMKAGIAVADAVTTVSPSYAEEILTPAYGCNLDGFLRRHAHKLVGIINGIDSENWNPATETMIPARYAPGRMQGKAICKQALQRDLGLGVDRDVPLLAAVARLTEQKGIDLLLAALPAWMEAGLQMVVLGSGEPAYEAMLRKLAASHGTQLHLHTGFNESLARRIYAGADIFVMPSRFEPCGLGQLIAMRYGTVPVVRATGGLKDTVIDYDQAPGRATGFTFAAAAAPQLKQALQRAVLQYRRPHVWRRIRGRGMRRDSSWQASARQYLALYNKLWGAKE